MSDSQKIVISLVLGLIIGLALGVGGTYYMLNSRVRQQTEEHEAQLTELQEQLETVISGKEAIIFSLEKDVASLQKQVSELEKKPERRMRAARIEKRRPSGASFKRRLNLYLLLNRYLEEKAGKGQARL